MNNQNAESFNNATLFIFNYLYEKLLDKVDFDSFDVAMRDLIKKQTQY